MKRRLDIKVEDVSETHLLGRLFASRLKDGDLVLLRGDLGAGKTQFVKGIASGLGIDSDIVSPTFNIVLSYDSGDIGLYHFDLYRLDDESQLEDIDFYSMTDSATPGISVVEWASLFPDAFGEDYISVDIERDPEDEGGRIIGIEGHGEASGFCSGLDGLLKDGLPTAASATGGNDAQAMHRDKAED